MLTQKTYFGFFGQLHLGFTDIEIDKALIGILFHYEYTFLYIVLFSFYAVWKTN